MDLDSTKILQDDGKVRTSVVPRSFQKENTKSRPNRNEGGVHFFMYYTVLHHIMINPSNDGGWFSILILI